MIKKHAKMAGLYLLGLALGLGGWLLSAGPGLASSPDVFELTMTSVPGLMVRVKEPFRITYYLDTRRTVGSDTKASVYLVQKQKEGGS